MKLATAEDLSVYVNLRMHRPLKVITPDRKVKSVISAHHDPDLNNKIVFTTDDEQRYPYEDLIYYRPEFDGAVTAVKIYLKDGYKPMAKLAFAFGGIFVFEWDRCDIREIFESGINAYTIFYDERTERPFSDWIKPIDGELYPELTLETAEIGAKYSFLNGWIQVLEIHNYSEEEANERNLMYLDHWLGVDQNGMVHGAAFSDSRVMSTTKNWEMNRESDES